MNNKEVKVDSGYYGKRAKCAMIEKSFIDEKDDLNERN